MKIVFISDTHGIHRSLDIPQGDMIIHAGDISGRGRIEEVTDFLDWFSNLDFSYKIFVAGNHDFFFERSSNQEIEKMIPKEVIYLNDTGVEIQGVNIWGSPVQPEFFNWAFNRKRGNEINEHWDLIPMNTDILITHGPPYGILDKTNAGLHVGCEELLKKIEFVKPKVHVFGHIHEAYGEKEIEATQYLNASVLNASYELKNPALVLELN